MRNDVLAGVAALLTLSIGASAQQKTTAPSLIKAGRLLDVRAGAYRLDQGLWIEGGRIKHAI